MKKAGLLFLFLNLVLVPALLGQLGDFGDRAVELRGLEAYELAKPAIPDDSLDTPPGQTIQRPLYLVLRYYSVVPWLRSHVRSVQTDAPGYDPALVEIDTGDDKPELQLLNEETAARQELAGRVLEHPGYGLYCIKIRICIPWNNWQPNNLHRFYVRFHHRHPYICWWDHWWYYWRHPRYAFRVNLNSSQEVPANSSPATGTGSLFLNADGTLNYDVNYGGLVADWTASHIHSPAPPGVNAGVLHALNNIPAGTRAGRLLGTTPAYTAAQIDLLRSGQQYVNIHTTQFPGGEIRAQIQQVPSPIYCPWGPSWIPLHRWGRGGPAWCLTVTHPYAFPWDPFWRPRPFCLYGLRSYFVPVGDVRNPGKVPNIAELSFARQPTVPWVIYPKPIVRYWPYNPYSARWYWWRCVPFNQWRHIPPVIQYSVWVNPQGDAGPTPQFPDDPTPIPGTQSLLTGRGGVSSQADINGDGFVTLADLSAYRAEQGGSSQDTADTDTTPAPARVKTRISK